MATWTCTKLYTGVCFLHKVSIDKHENARNNPIKTCSVHVHIAFVNASFFYYNKLKMGTTVFLGPINKIKSLKHLFEEGKERIQHLLNVLKAVEENQFINCHQLINIILDINSTIDQ